MKRLFKKCFWCIQSYLGRRKECVNSSEIDCLPRFWRGTGKIHSRSNAHYQFCAMDTRALIYLPWAYNSAGTQPSGPFTGENTSKVCVCNRSDHIDLKSCPNLVLPYC